MASRDSFDTTSNHHSKELSPCAAVENRLCSSAEQMRCVKVCCVLNCSYIVIESVEPWGKTRIAASGITGRRQNRQPSHSPFPNNSYIHFESSKIFHCLLWTLVAEATLAYFCHRERRGCTVHRSITLLRCGQGLPVLPTNPPMIILLRSTLPPRSVNTTTQRRGFSSLQNVLHGSDISNNSNSLGRVIS